MKQVAILILVLFAISASIARAPIALSDLGGFSLGDTVRVLGDPVCCEATFCAFDERCWTSAITSCRLTASAPVSWGRIKAVFK